MTVNVWQKIIAKSPTDKQSHFIRRRYRDRHAASRNYPVQSTSSLRAAFKSANLKAKVSLSTIKKYSLKSYSPKVSCILQETFS